MKVGFLVGENLLLKIKIKDFCFSKNFLNFELRISHFKLAFNIPLSNVSVSFYYIFIGRKLAQTHRSSCVKFLCGNAHFAAEAKLAAVCKTCRSIYVNGGTVYRSRKSAMFSAFSEIMHSL